MSLVANMYNIVGIEEFKKNQINNMDFRPVVNRLIKNYGWSIKSAKESEIQYKRYLFLKYKYDKYLLPPSKEIDEFWHNHILHTKKYHDDCKEIYGGYLHHQPQHGIGQITQTETERMFEQITQRLYFHEFGEYIKVVNRKLYKSNYWSKFYEKIIKLFVRHKKS